MPEEKPKKTIDERLEAVTMNLELLTADLETMREAQQRADRRERQLREALLRGVAGFLQGLGSNGE